MIKELVIHANSKGVEIALLENKKLVEYHLDAYDKEGFAAGDIYLGRVKKINPGLNAAFVDIGHDKDAFIHYSDLSPYIRSVRKFSSEAFRAEQSHLLDKFEFEPTIQKDGLMTDALEKGDILIFQISKEAISTKGPRLTCELSIPGRYVVLVPFTNSIGISKKIDKQEERERLIDVMQKIKPRNFGFVVRTNAEGVGKEELQHDVENLLNKWKVMTENIKFNNPPKLLLKEMSKTFSIVRDLMNDSFSKIITDNQTLHGDLKAYIKEHAPEQSSILNKYEDTTPLFETFDISRQVKTAFGKTVTLKSGAYVILEHTEALHVIDVNSGPKVKKDIAQDTLAFNINVEAAQEIARQLRLRDIGGIIVIDFIDMKSAEYKHKLYEAMLEAMKPDKAKHVILPVSKFGLMEITRQRMKEQVVVDTREPLLHANSKYKVDQPLQIIDNIEMELNHLKTHKEKNFLLYVHPFIYAFMKKDTFSFRMKWYAKAGKIVRLIQDSSLHLGEYKLLTKGGEKV
ncbi:MAG TPA: Rne/Rng family ribonuclease [Chitinophagales bacterium]|jgi:ribonuclease G|nr:Rne/Rng family ribonuclease [Chitinophagales bacterium]